MAGRDFEISKPKKRKFIHFKDLILHEDDRLVVVNKPKGIASLSDRDDELNMLVMARRYDASLKLCHRLDKQTSGVLLFAKGPEIYREIAILFEQREIHKHYLALVHGPHKLTEMAIELPIAVSGRGKARIDMGAGKESMTVVSTAELFRDFSLLNCHPLTGRMHQIRIHLSASDMPIVGDKVYGGKDILLSEIKRNFKPNRKETEPALNDTFLLHARGLMLVVPGDTEESTFIAPLPKKFEVVLKMLRKYNQAITY